jgi:opacity protein-like surface antigen
MKKAALAGIAALTLMDISAATPVAAQGISSFIGPYAGTHAGAFTSDATFSSLSYPIITPAPGTAPARNDSFDINGALVGIHGGINFLLGPNFIAGLEGDWTLLGEDDSVSFTSAVIGADGLSFQYRSELEYEWQSTIRGRFGFVTGNVLFFATAGVAFLNVDWTEVASKSLNLGPTTTFNHAKSETLTGGVVGAGVEIAITPVIIFGADYLYENFESFNSVPHGVEAGLTGKIDDIDVHKVRVRVSFKFGGPPQ